MLNQPTDWRSRARDARILVGIFRTDHSKQAMQAMAEQYDAKAEEEERRMGGGSPASPHGSSTSA